jgi:hypothetical protein
MRLSAIETAFWIRATNGYTSLARIEFRAAFLQMLLESVGPHHVATARTKREGGMALAGALMVGPFAAQAPYDSAFGDD